MARLDKPENTQKPTEEPVRKPGTSAAKPSGKPTPIITDYASL